MLNANPIHPQHKNMAKSLGKPDKCAFKRSAFRSPVIQRKDIHPKALTESIDHKMRCLQENVSMLKQAYMIQEKVCSSYFYAKIGYGLWKNLMHKILAPLGRVWQVGESCGQMETRCTGPTYHVWLYQQVALDVIGAITQDSQGSEPNNNMMLDLLNKLNISYEVVGYDGH
ncbi:hypothetical protein NQZ79_g3790 [Umbelopsis isabellina]|nr:hypothetical protein NQZ79_g3790 [Umbelopsis isabellina]